MFKFSVQEGSFLRNPYGSRFADLSICIAFFLVRLINPPVASNIYQHFATDAIRTSVGAVSAVHRAMNQASVEAAKTVAIAGYRQNGSNCQLSNS